MDIEKIVLLLFGGVIGFFVSIAKDYFIEKTKRKHKEIELKRGKAEELYILLEKWSNKFFSNSNHLELVMKGSITYNEYLDYIIEDSDSTEYLRIEMLIKIYFKDLFHLYEKVLKQRENINNVQYLYKEEYKVGNLEGSKYIDPLMVETLKINKYIDELKNQIALFVNSLK
jgi:hypothetical protein